MCTPYIAQSVVCFAVMVDGSGTLEAKVLLEFASNVFETWAEYLGATVLGRAADAT